MAALDNAGPSVKNTIGTDLIEAFRAGLARLEALMRWSGMKVITARIEKSAGLLGHSLSELTARVRHFVRFGGDSALIGAAGRILAMLEHYGSISRKPYDVKAGIAKTVLDNMNGPYAADVTALGIEGLKDALQTAYDFFTALLKEREAAERTKPKDPDDPSGNKADTFRKARKAIEAIYHEIAEIVNSGAKLGLSPEFAALASVLNPEIARLNFEFRHVRYDIALAEIASIPDAPWTGEQITPVPEALLRMKNGKEVKLTFGTDYTLTYKNNIEAGTAYCILRGKGGYKGSKTVSFIIRRGGSGAAAAVNEELGHQCPYPNASGRKGGTSNELKDDRRESVHKAVKAVIGDNETFSRF